MAEALETITNAQQADEAVSRIASGDLNELVLLELAGGVLRFTDVVFGGDNDALLAKKVVRTAEGRGPHFDVYKDLLSSAFPYIGLYNLSGTATVTTAPLSADLAAAYWETFPEHNDEAHDARRKFGFVALTAAGDAKRETVLKPRTGFILPQNHDQPIVHEVIPTDPAEPGAFVKLVVPHPSPEAQKFLRDDGYQPLDEVITQALSGTIIEPGKEVIKKVRVGRGGGIFGDSGIVDGRAD